MRPQEYFRKQLARHDPRSVAWALRYAKSLYPILGCQEWHDRMREALREAEEKLLEGVKE